MKNKTALGFKIIITICLLVVIYSQLELSLVYEKISRIKPIYIAYFAFLYLFSQLVNAFKWSILLKEAGVIVPFFSVLKAFFLGMFVNTFGVGTIGGDFARAVSIPCDKGKRSVCVSSVLSDRIMGLTTLLFIGAVSLLIFHPPYIPDLVIFMLFCIVISLIFLWVLGPKLFLRFIPQNFKKRDFIINLISAFPSNPMIILYVSIISMIFHSIQIFLAVNIFNSIKAGISYEIAFSSIPFINIASSLPITVNGMGVREAVGIYILQPAGVLNETTVVFAAVWLIIVSLVSAILGLLVLPSFGENASKYFSFKKEKKHLV